MTAIGDFLPIASDVRDVQKVPASCLSTYDASRADQNLRSELALPACQAHFPKPQAGRAL